jgi:polyferredoxin
MECIACTACIDACDEIMLKVNKPKGLIRYAAMDGGKGKYIRSRSLAYSFIILAAFAGLVYNVINRTPLEIFILRGKETPYQLTQNIQGHATAINHMRLHLRNQTFSVKDIKIVAPEEWNLKGIQMMTAEPSISLSPGDFKMVHFFVTVPTEVFDQLGQFKTAITIEGIKKEFTLIGPEGIKI